MRMEADEYLVVVNASNRVKILEHWKAVAQARDFKVKIEDRTEKTAMVALQGPRVMDLISGVSKEIPTLKRYRFAVKNLLVLKLIVSRTGYTGEDGVEVILPASAVGMAMKLLLKDVDQTKADAVLKPAGLAARDSLRLEAGMPLYGHELGEEINALSCGVDFAISLDKTLDKDGENFIGQDALARTRDAGGPDTRLVGIEIEGKRTARQGMPVLVGGQASGVVTSGCLSPTLDKSIAMAFVRASDAAVGTEISVDAGRATLTGRVVPMPFYTAPKARSRPRSRSASRSGRILRDSAVRSTRPWCGGRSARWSRRSPARQYWCNGRPWSPPGKRCRAVRRRPRRSCVRRPRVPRRRV
jgi:aminomethyltransferase